MVQSWLLYNRANIHDSTWKAFFVSSMMHQLRLRYSSCDTSNVFLMFVFVYLNWFICIFSLVHQLRLMYPAWWHVKCVLHSVCDKTVSSKNWVEQKKVQRSCWASAAAAAGVIAATLWNKENFNRVSKLLLFRFFLQLTDFNWFQLFYYWLLLWS